MENINFFDALFYRNLKESNQEKILNVNYANKEIVMSTDVVKPIKYRRNSYGYRASEFNKNTDIITLGCSQTHGHGMEEEYIWPTQVAKLLNMTHSNLACGGDGMSAQIYKAFQYFKEFGNPKIIFASFPLRRMEFPYIKDKTNKSTLINNAVKNSISQYFLDPDIKSYSKSPYNPEEVLPIEVAIFYNFSYLNMLEQYCNANNIKLIWDCWESYLLNDYLKDKSFFKNYLNFNFMDFYFDEKTCIETYSKSDTCHNENKNHPLFYRAADFEKGKNHGHWGIHLHTHIAEAFVSKYLVLTKE
ncbi:hypothetical protein UFOVP204_86 [uncultured Caudovirales phage]|uniref:Uncharacterized protein n=1 Tax=uncultured Caudovirales phage TaxID=2100421 RepID=A0A6J7WQ12_9CAUD|nr:hypothetical protein UFOVP204_86 [uncultured Caudovirales phage]